MTAAVYAGMATALEFGGAPIIAFHALLAFARALGRQDALEARKILSKGAITGLDFKLAGTLLKTLTLAEAHQIEMFAVTLALRIFLKKSFQDG